MAVQKKTIAPSVNLQVRVPASTYDAIYAQARAERLSMADWLRRVLRKAQPGKRP
jgi:predicted HicB family RNase H-like nuclease